MSDAEDPTKIAPETEQVEGRESETKAEEVNQDG